jgi:hypothetical protein
MTSLIVIVAGIGVVAFTIVVIVIMSFWIFVWYPAKRQRSLDAKKASGRMGEATILRVPDLKLYPRSGRSRYMRVEIGLEIRVPGIETYEVDKTFTIPRSGQELLEKGQVVTVWVDPNEPRNLDRIVFELKSSSPEG